MSSPSSSSETPKRPTIPHLPGLDGLRGLAVLGVLFFHDGRLEGGYLGVDLFFVLSGYLITSLLLSEWAQSGTVDLKHFWFRRARRLFPAVLALLPLVGLLSFWFIPAVDRGRIRGDGIAALLYFANWHSVYSGRSYWDMFRAPSPFEHTWSLAIEEQFYVLWPLLAFLTLRRFKGSPKAMFSISLGLGLLSAAAMVWLGRTPSGTARAYMGTDTRGAAILLGAALASAIAMRGTLKSPLHIKLLDGLGVICGLFLGFTWVFLTGQDLRLYQGGFFLTELCVLVLIACAAHGEKSLVAKVFSNKLLTNVGLWSYGLYLYHWPVYVLISPERTGLAGPVCTLARFGATFAIALVSYRFLEQPIRKRGLWFGKPILVLPSAVLLCTAVLVWGTQSVPLAKKALLDYPFPRIAPPPSYRILVVGDSVAQALGERMRAVASDLDVSVFERGTPNCSILEGKLPTRSLTNEPHTGGNCAARWEADMDEVKPKATLVILGGGHFAPVEVDGKWQKACEPGWTREYGKELQARLKALTAKSGKVYVARVAYPIGGWFKPGRNEMVDCLNALVLDAAKKIPGLRVLDVQEYLCPNRVCATHSEGEPIRPDGLHFGGQGSKEIARFVIGKLKE